MAPMSFILAHSLSIVAMRSRMLTIIGEVVIRRAVKNFNNSSL